jgi:hypothetical protein
LRQPKGEAESIGISITWDEVSKADVVLWISDATRAETRIVGSEIQRKLPAGAAQIRIENKIDLMKTPPLKHSANGIIEISLSAKTGAGIDLLRTAILDVVGWSQREGEGIYMARARHLQALHEAATHLMRAAEHAGQVDLLAEELRLSQRALGSITGAFTADDLLGEIFSRCIHLKNLTLLLLVEGMPGRRQHWQARAWAGARYCLRIMLKHWGKCRAIRQSAALARDTSSKKLMRLAELWPWRLTRLESSSAH